MLNNIVVKVVVHRVIVELKGTLYITYVLCISFPLCSVLLKVIRIIRMITYHFILWKNTLTIKLKCTCHTIWLHYKVLSFVVDHVIINISGILVSLSIVMFNIFCSVATYIILKIALWNSTVKLQRKYATCKINIGQINCFLIFTLYNVCLYTGLTAPARMAKTNWANADADVHV